MRQVIYFQRLEGLAVFFASLFFYLHLQFTIWYFVVFLFSIDICMLGYLRSARTGAYVYNAGHSMIAPAILLVIGTAGSFTGLVAFGIIWTAHIGCDRALGYGLKYENGFRYTHLGNLSRTRPKHFE